MRMGKPYDLVFTTKIVAVLTFLFTGRKKSVFLYTFDTKVEFTYSQLMTKLLRLPKYLQMEIGKALIANASEGFEEEEE